MKQEDDLMYSKILFRLRRDYNSENYINELNSRKINFIGSTSQEKLQELYNYLETSSSDTVCILSTRFMCYT